MSPTFSYSDLLPVGEDLTKYRFLGSDGDVSDESRALILLINASNSGEKSTR